VGEDRPQTSRQRVTVAQAAEILGVTVEAIRGRIKRKTLEHERHSGTVYVLLDADQSTNRTRPGDDQTADRLQSDGTALISAKDETIATLREQLEAERNAHAEARRLLLEALTKIPSAIEAPQEATEAAETVEEEQGRGWPAPTRYRRGSGGRTEAVAKPVALDTQRLTERRTIVDHEADSQMQDRMMEGERIMGREDTLSEMMQRSGVDDREFAKYLRSLEVRIARIEAQLERDK